jgi:hypothetical protein
VKVRAIEPRTDDAELEELVAEEAPAGDRPGRTDPAVESRTPAAGPSPDVSVRLVAQPRRVTASDLGPNGDVVLDLLSRASRLTPAECRSLDKEAGWRWWLMTPLPGAGMLGAHATAVARARADGRSEALVALETAVTAIVLRVAGPKAGRSRLRACISNAGLAVLVRDLIEPEAFETLFGPWREVMHH